MMILCPWISYLVADGLQLSGIVAILTNGLFLNMYATPNISKGSGKVLKIAYETIALLWFERWLLLGISGLGSASRGWGHEKFWLFVLRPRHRC